MENKSRQFPRYLPCLWDKLQDDEPLKKEEATLQRSVTPRHYREAVARDLGWALNSPAPYKDTDLRELDEVATSVLNYGIHSFAGQRTSDLARAEIESHIRTALLHFEPRLIPGSLKVESAPMRRGQRINQLAFVISGQIWAMPFPEELYLYTELDLENGEFRTELQ
ncbi:MAG: type VI secretion system baseplate subunit TssE [Puniceicoccales bacterium]